MDIRRWLEGTADREPPDRSDDINIPEKFPEPDQVVRGYRYKRKRASSESSIITPQQNYHWNAEPPIRALSPDHLRQAEDVTRGSRRKNKSRPSSSSQRDVAAKTYERRARRKTRPDRYEPKVKKQKTARDTSKGRNKNQKRRRSQRVDNGGRTTGLIQSFQLNNGRKNNRLTLKPDTSAGLFKYGRASVQMTGRGGGLPDLTFNEMKFLQKPAAHKDNLQGVDETHKSKTKDQRQDHGEEISAFFNSKAAITTKRPESHNDQKGGSKRDDELPTRSKRSKETNLRSPLVELPDNPFLGFGSKGTLPLSNGTNNQSTNYYTWSETGHRPSSSSCRRQVEIDADKLEPSRRPGRNESLRDWTGEAETAHAKTAVAQPARNSNKDINRGIWRRTGRGGGLAHVEVYQPPNRRKRKRRAKTPVIQTTSQSLPRHPSSPPQFRQHAMNDAVTGPRDQYSYHTSDILRIHDRPMEDAYSSLQSRRLAPHMDQHKENRDPESSLSIDKAIRRAIAAVQTQHFITQPLIQAQNPEVARLPNIRKLPSINDLPKIRQLDAAHRTRTPGAEPSQLNHSYPFQFQWQSPARYRPLSNTERKRWETTALKTLVARIPQMDKVRTPAYVDEDEEMLDNTPDGEPVDVVSSNAFMGSRYEDGLSHDRRFTPRSSIFGAPINVSGHRPPVSVSKHELLRAGPVRGLSIENEVHREKSTGHQAGRIDERLAGFWKPNRLY